MSIAVQVALVMVVLLVLLLAAGVPIGVGIGLSSAVSMICMLPSNVAFATSAQRIFAGSNSFSLIAIPFFILAGNIMNNGGIALRLVNCAKVIGGRMPGALAQSNVIANMLFGAISGSGAAAAAAIGSTMGPLEEAEGYDKNYSAAVNVASAPVGMLIPPSNTMIVYSTVAGSVSISALFMAGYVPGLIWGLGVIILATITAKNIEQIKSFLSRQKETYKVPYEVYPEDRPRQCVFCGTSNDLNFLPLDRTGNRRFAPVMTDITKAKVHILDNEEESRAYIVQAWAEAMVLYQQGNVYLSFTKEIEEEAKKLQKEFMPEDTNAGIIQAFLDDYEDDYVCTKLLFDDALHRTGEMKQWESKEIANIMNNAIEGWKQHGTHRFGKEYGIQRSWKRIEGIEKKDKDGFMEVPEQLEIPFE